MKLKTVLFELGCAGLLIITGAWLYLHGYTNPGLMSVGVILMVVSLSMHAGAIRHLAPRDRDLSRNADILSQQSGRG